MKVGALKKRGVVASPLSLDNIMEPYLTCCGDACYIREKLRLRKLGIDDAMEFKKGATAFAKIGSMRWATMMKKDV